MASAVITRLLHSDSSFLAPISVTDTCRHLVSQLFHMVPVPLELTRLTMMDVDMAPFFSAPLLWRSPGDLLNLFCSHPFT